MTLNLNSLDVASFIAMGATPSTTLTVTSSQTTAQSLTIPNITVADQMTTDKFATTLFNKGFVGGTSYSTYSTGTVTISGTTVTGSGTSFSPGMAGGTFIASNGASGMIYQVNSNTTITLLNGTIAGGPGLTYNIYYDNFVVDPSYGAGAVDFLISNVLYFTDGLSIEIDNLGTTNTLTLGTSGSLAPGNLSIIVPSVTANDTFVTNNFPATLTNKNLSDSTTYVVDVADATKRIGFDVTGSTGTTLNVTSAQTTSQTLNLPNITQTDTAIVSFLPQTEYKKVMIGGQDAFSSTLNTYNGSPFISVPSNTGCQNIAFTPDGLTAYVANTGSNNIRVYSLKTAPTGSITATLIATWTPAGLSPTGICYNPSSGGLVIVTSSTNGNYAAYSYNAGNGASPINPVLTLASGTGYPVPSRDGNYVYVTTTSAISIVVANGSSKTDIIAGSISGLPVSLVKGAAAASNGTEVYIIQGNLSINVSYFTISGGTGTTPAGSISFSSGIPRYIIADKQRNFVYAADTTTIYVISTVSKTVTNTITGFGASNISYLSISNDNTYMYITDIGTAKIHMLNLSTLVASTIINPVSTPSTMFTAVPDPINKYLYIVGNDASEQVAGYDIVKSQYTTYSVGQASQSGNIIIGTLGTEWNKQMMGGVIVYANGVTCDISYDPDNIVYNQFTTTISQTVAQQNYTIFYRTTLVNPTGSGIVGDGTILINPTIGWKGDTTSVIQFDMSANSSGSGIILTTAQTATSPQILNIPNFTSTDTMMTLGTNQTITGTKTFNAEPVMTSIFNGGTITIPSGADTFATLTAIQTLTNKSLLDASTFIIDDGVPSKRLAFQLAGSTANTTLTITTAQSANQSIAIPNVGAGESFVTLNTAQTLTNKTVSIANEVWTTPSAPSATNLRLFGESIGSASAVASRCMASQIDATSTSYEFQPFFATKRIAMATGTGVPGATVPHTFGMTMIAAVGNITAQNTVGNAGAAAASRRIVVSTVSAAANTSAYFAQSTTPNTFYYPNGINPNGYHFVCKFCFNENTPIGTNRLFIGLTSAVPGATVNPMATGAGNHMVGLAVNSGSGNMSFYTRNATTGAAAGTVTSAAWPPVATSVYTFFMYQAPGVSTTYMGIQRWDGTIAGYTKFEAALTVNYPANGLFPIIWLNSGSDAAAVRGIGLISLYIESEY